MTTSKPWTLKDSKEDQTTPGPVYQTQFLQSIHYTCDKTKTAINGTFGSDRKRQYTVQHKGLEKHYFGTESPGPFARYGEKKSISELKPVLSVCKNSEKYSFPKKPRIAKDSKVDGPNPQYYKNSNEIAAKVTLKRNGCYSMGKAD